MEKYEEYENVFKDSSVFVAEAITTFFLGIASLFFGMALEEEKNLRNLMFLLMFLLFYISLFMICKKKEEFILDLGENMFSFKKFERSTCTFKLVEEVLKPITDVYVFKLVYMEMNEDNKSLFSINRKKPCSDSLRSIKEIKKQILQIKLQK